MSEAWHKGAVRAQTLQAHNTLNRDRNKVRSEKAAVPGEEAWSRQKVCKDLKRNIMGISLFLCVCVWLIGSFIYK